MAVNITLASVSVDASGTTLTTLWNTTDFGLALTGEGDGGDYSMSLTGGHALSSGLTVGTRTITLAIAPPVLAGEALFFSILANFIRDEGGGINSAVTNAAVNNGSQLSLGTPQRARGRQRAHIVREVAS